MTNRKSDLGEKIDKAINENNFSDVGDLVQKAVNNSINTIKEVINNFSYSNKDGRKYIPIKDPRVASQVPLNSGKAGFYPSFGGLLIIFGILLSLSCPFVVWEGINTSFYGLVAGIITGIIGITSLKTGISFLKEGNAYRFLNKRYMRYLKEFGMNTVITVRDLATSVMQSDSQTVADLKKLIKDGYFKQARLVENDNLFLLNVESYKAYKAYKDKKTSIFEFNDDKTEETEEKKEIIDDLFVKKTDDEKKQEYDEVLSKVSNYLKIIDNLKEKIDSKDFFAKVIELRSTVNSILMAVKNHPEGIYALNKFIDYYLPTTVKLIESYVEFEGSNSDDKKIINSMNEIGNSIVTINDAFENILAQLFEDKAIDVKTDIDTLNLILRQEGLLDSGFNLDSRENNER